MQIIQPMHIRWPIEGLRLYLVPRSAVAPVFVRGTGRTNAIMTAVDEAGSRAVRYRIVGAGFILGREKIEITVHPDLDLTDELVLAIAISAPWLSPYFDQPGGG